MAKAMKKKSKGKKEEEVPKKKTTGKGKKAEKVVEKKRGRQAGMTLTFEKKTLKAVNELYTEYKQNHENLLVNMSLFLNGEKKARAKDARQSIQENVVLAKDLRKAIQEAKENMVSVKATKKSSKDDDDDDDDDEDDDD